jgi:putative NADH-flavin reductase
MRLTVFGSTGPLGIEVIKQALNAGCDIVAYARNKEKLNGITHKRLEIVEGDLANKKEIERALMGAEAAISLLGPKGKLHNTELSDGIEMIIEAMDKIGIKRLVALSTGSVRDPLDRLDLRYRFFTSTLRIAMNGTYREIIRISELIRSSDLEWTLVRVGLLNNGEAKELKAGYYGHDVVDMKISRASIARFMLDQVKSNEYMRKSPAISN